MKNQHRQFIGISLLALMVFGVPAPINAALQLSNIFSDHMVLQRDQAVAIWGWADSQQMVTVRFADQVVSVKSTENGAWLVQLDPLEASDKGRDLQVKCQGDKVRLQNVVVGDVWHASGQSNMAMTLSAVATRLPLANQHLIAAELPLIRFRRVRDAAALEPSEDLKQRASWTVCAPETAGSFSAVAFYFARKLHTELDVPIGIIDTSRGGTPIEPYIPRAAFAAHPTLRRELELGDQDDLSGLRRLPGGVRARDENWLPARLFHSRLAPIRRLAVRGAIWYQGESNSGNGEDPRDYQHKMHALITGWRTAFDAPSLPFYFVQLPGSGAGPGWPFLREQQRLAARLPHTAMVVTIDLIDDDIHPANKVDVGERLGLAALSQEYGQDLVFSGPRFERVEIVDGLAVVYFSQAEKGLMAATKDGVSAPRESPQAALSHFELADSDGRWHKSTAIVRGQTVSVRCDGLANPIAVRYAYAVSPDQCILYNRAGLPASPFCSEPTLLKYSPESPSE